MLVLYGISELTIYVCAANYILLLLVRLCSKNYDKKTTLTNIGKLGVSIL